MLSRVPANLIERSECWFGELPGRFLSESFQCFDLLRAGFIIEDDAVYAGMVRPAVGPGGEGVHCILFTTEQCFDAAVTAVTDPAA